MLKLLQSNQPNGTRITRLNMSKKTIRISLINRLYTSKSTIRPGISSLNMKTKMMVYEGGRVTSHILQPVPIQQSIHQISSKSQNGK